MITDTTWPTTLFKAPIQSWWYGQVDLGVLYGSRETATCKYADLQKALNKEGLIDRAVGGLCTLAKDDHDKGLTFAEASRGDNTCRSWNGQPVQCTNDVVLYLRNAALGQKKRVCGYDKGWSGVVEKGAMIRSISELVLGALIAPKDFWTLQMGLEAEANEVPKTWKDLMLEAAVGALLWNICATVSALCPKKNESLLLEGFPLDEH